jgi:hypothetical protein
LENTPVPLYVQSSSGNATGAELTYRASGGSWISVRMLRTGQGYAAEIPCAAVRAPAVEYYVTATDDQSRVVGEAGTETAPNRVEVVVRRTRPAPYIPGRLPPESCATARRGRGAACARSDQCAAGLECAANVCAPANTASPPGGRTWVAFNLGGGLGVGFLDVIGSRPAYAEVVTPPDNPRGNASCDPPLSCPARVSGFGLTPHVVIQARVHVIPRVAIGAAVRWQPDSASRTTLAPVLLQLRGYFAATPAGFARSGLVVAPFAGTGVGQIQPRAAAPSAERAGAPTGHLITGLNNIHAGAMLEYAFLPVLHAGGELALHVMFPKLYVDVDLQAYVGLHF